MMMMDGEIEERRAPAKERAKTVEWIVKEAQLALAVAVIKSRPPGKSGRQYAEALTCQLRSHDEGWRNKAEGLQEEVLRLRQELLLTKMISKPTNTGEAAGDGMMDILSQDLIGSAKDLSSDLDSGCGSENNTDPQFSTQDSADTKAYWTALPPVTSGSLLPFSSGQGGSSQEKAMLLHMQFLQSLCGLQRVEGEGGLEFVGLSLDRDMSLMADSVCQLLYCVGAASKDAQPLPPNSLLLQACRVAARAVDALCFQRQPSVQFVTYMDNSLKELTRVLLHNDQLNRFQAEEKLTECLVILGGSSLLSSLLIRHFLSEINRLADHLWQTCQGDGSTGLEQLAAGQYENSFYLFWILEQLLQVPRREGRLGVTSHHWTPEQKVLQGHLEHSILPLSDEFPLFALYMWRIGALLSSPHQSPPRPKPSVL